MSKAQPRPGARVRSAGGRGTRARVGWVRDLVRLVADELAQDAVLTYAAAISFRALVALVPLLLLGFGLLGAFGLRDVWSDAIAPAVKPHVTTPVFEAADSSVQKIFASSAAGLIAFAALLLLFDLTLAVVTAMGALNRIYDVEERRSWWRRHGVAAALAVVLTFCLVGSVLVVAVAPRATEGPLDVLLSVARWPLGLLLLALAVGLLVRYAPAERPRARWASAGSLLVIASWVVASLVFRWWIDSVANFKTAVGTLAVFLVLTAYVYVSVTIFLVGVQVDELVRREHEDEDVSLLALVRGALGR
jgi:membrane protein